MILAVSIVTGFQERVRDKIATFEGHIRISNYDFNSSMELSAIEKDSNLESTINSHKGIKSISPFAIKGGIIKANNIVQGCLLKGIDETYDWSFFNSWIIKGRTPNIKKDNKSKEILISQSTANKLHLDVDSSFLVYFMQDPPRIRKFNICGIYQSGFPDFDNKMIYGDIKQIRKLNKWSDTQFSGYEIYVNNYSEMNELTQWIHQEISYDLKAQDINTRYLFIMEWLNLLDTNVFFILGLMVLISGVGMIATLLILILEKTKFIGTMKAIGATNKSIRKIFLIHGIHISIKGLLYGNVIGIGIALLQKYFNIIPLDPNTYYMSSVPINIDIPILLLLNIGVISIIAIMMWLPSHIISSITPVKALRYN